MASEDLARSGVVVEGGKALSEVAVGHAGSLLESSADHAGDDTRQKSTGRYVE